MSSADANPGPNPPADPCDQPVSAGVLPHLGRVLAVLRSLIGYGEHIAGELQRRIGRPILRTAVLPFGTLDTAVVLQRIACGLRRAAALEARLTAYAACGRDLPAPEPEHPPRERAPRQQSACATRARRAPRQDPLGLPTAEQIAAEVRRRPIGAVIADICRDLGLLPGQCGREFWQELSDIITGYGGTLSRWVTSIDRRIRQVLRLTRGEDDAPPPASRPCAPPTAEATGPPDEPDGVAATA